MFRRKKIDGESNMWDKNKDTIKWFIGFAISAAVGWGSATTKIATLQAEINELKNKYENIVQLRIETAKIATGMEDLKENNRREHREIKQSIKP